MPQFTRQSSRPLGPASYLAFARRLRKAADDIERYAYASSVRERQSRSNIITGLASAMRSFLERRYHDRR